MYFENYDLDNIITPVKVAILEKLLLKYNYPMEETEFLVDGFTNRFNICYEGLQTRKSKAANIPINPEVGNRTILWNKLMKEVKAKRVAGPFKEIPFDQYIQSPIGLVPKIGSDQTRLIFHLSYDFAKTEGDIMEGSLNYHTPKNKCSVHYNDIDYAV